MSPGEVFTIVTAIGTFALMIAILALVLDKLKRIHMDTRATYLITAQCQQDDNRFRKELKDSLVYEGLEWQFDLQILGAQMALSEMKSLKVARDASLGPEKSISGLGASIASASVPRGQKLAALIRKTAHVNEGA